MRTRNYFRLAGATVALAALSSILLQTRVQAQVSEEMFPFVIPGLASPPAGSIVDLSWLNDAPAGAQGFVRVRDGHFVDGAGKRVRFLASNFTFGSCFPDHDTADKLAARLASLGINCIRFHHLDNRVAPGGIWKAGTPKKNQFDPDQVDRMDYFIAALKRHGIYADINLHISRNYWEGEDFPDGLANDRERQAKLPSFGKHIDKINDQMIRMQRDYARTLLIHTNPYTHTSYAKEPCVTVIEINNENSLMELKVNSLPEYYRADVLKKWNQWLEHRYGSSEKLTAAWGGREELGTNILTVRPTLQSREYLAVSDAGAGETRISLLKSPEVSWHAQVLWTGLSLEEGRLYTLGFSARSDHPRRLPLSVRLNQPNWHNCGLSETAEIGPGWKSFTYAFRAAHVKPGEVRLDIDAGGGPVGDLFIKDLNLCCGGTLGLTPGESLEAGNVQAPVNTGGTPRGLAWTQFLAESERAYSDGMRAFLKKDLRVEANLVDSQASYGGIAGAYRESFSDYVDMHAYWQHPEFPGRPWDPANWNIRNTPMVADQHGGTLPELAFYRQAGKPFTVSEYDHPAPTHYAAEMFPIIASFAALQDWDGVFQFDWGVSADFDAQRIGNFFSLQQHPGKLAFLPAAALMFRRGDVAAATATAHLAIPETQVAQLTANNVSMAEAWQEAGVSLTTLLNHRLELGFLESPVPLATSPHAQVDPSASSPLSWNAAAGLYTVDAPAAKAVVGRCTGKSTPLHGAVFDVQTNARNYAVLTLNAMDAQPLAQSHRLLLTAAGNVENTGMGWNAAHTSVGNHWGKAPTLCEGIKAKVMMNTSAKAAKVYALDGSGARAGELPATLASGKLSFEIGPQFKTLWYEIAAD